jgi:alpha-tubulin suppressor-like RCC1 family protein
MRATGHRRRALLAVALLAGCLAIAQPVPTPALAAHVAPEPTFARQFERLGAGAWSLATGDVDGDDDVDFVAANVGDESITVVLGNGDGTLQPHATHPTTSGAKHVALGDIDEDGDLDLLVADYLSSDLSIHLGNGDGTFAARSTLPMGGESQWVSVGDVDDDLHLDLAVAVDGNVAILLGNGDGTFAAPTEVVEPGVSEATVLVDIDDDDDLDLVSTSHTPAAVHVLLNDGTGAFVLDWSDTTGSTAAGEVVADDLDVDGDLDLVVATSDDAVVYLADGTGDFVEQASIDTGEGGPFEVAVGDVNGDGFPDVALTYSFRNTRLLVGHGDGSFTSTVGCCTGEDLAALITDVNDDGDADMIVTTSSNTVPYDGLIVYVNTSGLAMAPPTPTAGDGEVTLSWTAPDTGATVIAYRITPFFGPFQGGDVYVDVADTTHTLTGLANGATYRFRIAAETAVTIDADGGPSSASSGPITPFDRVPLAGGAAHSCRVTSVETVRCWGSNTSGQLGDGTTASRPTPATVPGLGKGVLAVTAGEAHTCAVLVTNTVRCWGDNAFGQLGDGTTTSRATPTPVPGLTGVIGISARRDHTCALRAGGSVRCWGYNVHGEVGDGTTTNRRSPTPVVGLTGATEITTGSWHSCARFTGATVGRVSCWGSNSRGQLGDGTTTDRHTPVEVSGLTGTTAVAALGSSTCALRPASVRCWGFNHHGQLGTGTTANRTTPGFVTGITNPAGLAGGLYHACARLTTGAVRCWGAADEGQVGDGGLTERHTPVAVTGLGDVAELAAGWDHNLAMQSTLARWGWGANESGQIGNGSTATPKRTPVSVVP